MCLTSGELQGWALAETEKSDPRVELLPYISLRGGKLRLGVNFQAQAAKAHLHRPT